MAIIEVKNLFKKFVIPHERRDSLRESFVNIFRSNKYEEFNAIEDLSFSVEEGEFFGIIGRNGSGKSTLLKILARTYVPTKGSAKISGSIAPFLELGVGFNHELSGRENVFLNGTILGLSQKQLEEKYDEIIAFAELERFMDQKLKNYSSGMQVRLAFSIAIQAGAKVFLLDEVLAVGDSDFQRKCMAKFRELKENKQTVVFVTHDLMAVRQFCDRVLYIKDGKIMALGEPAEVIDQYVYQDRAAIAEEAVVEDARPVVGDAVVENGPSVPVVNSKEVEIVKVEYLDRHGKDNEKFVSGDPITFRIHYKKNKEVPSVVCGLAVYKHDGTHIYGTNSFLQDKKMVLKKTGYVDFKTDSLNLLSGDYAMTVAFCSEDGRSYDWRDKEFYFTVVNSSQDDGFVSLNFEFIN